jgi:hypothetical protein
MSAEGEGWPKAQHTMNKGFCARATELGGGVKVRTFDNSPTPTNAEAGWF